MFTLLATLCHCTMCLGGGKCWFTLSSMTQLLCHLVMMEKGRLLLLLPSENSPKYLLKDIWTDHDHTTIKPESSSRSHLCTDNYFKFNWTFRIIVYYLNQSFQTDSWTCVHTLQITDFLERKLLPGTDLKNCCQLEDCTLYVVTRGHTWY